ncbi:MAG: nucleoid-associated protein [Streptococcaceae bacterium]|nr:nucleoid-associated protein [Streptococcaceae bacterium]
MDFYIKKAILHAFDPGQSELSFSEDLMTLTPVMLDYVTRKVEKIYSDDAKRGTLSAYNHFLSLVTDDFIGSTVAIANFWREEFILSEKQKQNDLLFVSYELDTQPHFAFIRLALRESFSHMIDTETGQIKIRKSESSLPGAGSAADEAIAINLATAGYHLLEKRIKYNGKLYHYFSEKLLAEQPEISVNKAIKTLKKTAESVGKSYDKDAFAFSQKVQNAVFHAVEKQEELNPEALADQLFADNLTARLDFKDQVKAEIPEQIRFEQLPMAKLEKKLANQKLSLSNGIEMIVPQQLYEDAETVEFIQNDDGTYSIIIKNIEEIKNKW